MDDLQNRVRNDIFNYAVASGMTFYDTRSQHGLLRNLMLRNSNSGEWMLLIQFHYDESGDDERAKALLDHVAATFPEITSLIYVDNQKRQRHRRRPRPHNI